MKKVYKVTEGAQFSQKEAQAYGRILEEITERKGQLKPQYVIDEAKNKKSPLHNYFDWNNSSAGEKWRRQQATHLITHITCIVRYDHTQIERKVFLSVQTTPNEDIKNVAYLKFEEVMSKPELRVQALRKALRELEYWKETYAEYSELSRIFKAMDKTKARLFGRLRKGRKVNKKNKSTKKKR